MEKIDQVCIIEGIASIAKNRLKRTIRLIAIYRRLPEVTKVTMDVKTTVIGVKIRTQSPSVIK